MPNITTLAIDKAIKNRAAVRARQERLSVSAVARILLSEYAAGRIKIGTRVADDDIFSAEIMAVDDETKSLMRRISNAWLERKDQS